MELSIRTSDESPTTGSQAETTHRERERELVRVNRALSTFTRQSNFGAAIH